MLPLYGGGMTYAHGVRWFDAGALAELINEAGRSVPELAREAEVSELSIRYWLNGRNHPKPPKLARLMAILGQPIASVMSVSPTQWQPAHWRISRGMTRAQLAAAAGLTRDQLCCIEFGYTLRPDRAGAITSCLQIPYAEYIAAWERAHYYVALVRGQTRVQRVLTLRQASAFQARVAGRRDAKVLAALGDLSTLGVPPSYVVVAQARRDHPDMSIAQLGGLLGMSKDSVSGVLRRFWRAVEVLR